MQRIAVIIGGLALFAAMGLGALVTHPDYSSLSHTTSELAGQSMPNAWIMRAGFAIFGLSALAAAGLSPSFQWVKDGPVVAFGLGLVGAAVWSSAPISADLPHSLAEDWWHSVFASGLGFAFALACTARLIWNDPGDSLVLNLSGLAISVGVPLAMLRYPEIDGLLQRLMFAFSVLWLVWHYGKPHVQDRT